MFRKQSVLIILAVLMFVGIVTANVNQATLKEDNDWFAPLVKADKDKIDDEYLIDLYLESHLPKHIKHLEQCLEPDEASHDLLHQLREREQEYERRRSSRYWSDGADMYKAKHLTKASLDCIRRDPGVEEVGENYHIYMHLIEPPDGYEPQWSEEDIQAFMAEAERVAAVDKQMAAQKETV